MPKCPRCKSSELIRTQEVSELHQFVCRDETRLRRHLSDLADHLVTLREQEFAKLHNSAFESGPPQRER